MEDQRAEPHQDDQQDVKLLGLHVAQYKQLVDVWLPLDRSAAIFGVNGVGKSTLFECLALIAGSARSTEVIWRRTIEPRPGALALIARVPAALALLAPRDVQAVEDAVRQLRPDDIVDQVRELAPTLDVAGPSLRWWRTLNVSSDLSLEDGLAELGIPARLLEWLTGLLRYPLVRYSLTGISLESDSDDFPRARRILECTLLAEDLPTWLVRATDELPDVLAPLAGSLGGAPPPSTASTR